MTNEQLIVLLRGYEREFQAARNDIMEQLEEKAPDLVEIKPHPFAPGVYAECRILQQIDDTIESLQDDIRQLEPRH